MPSITMTACPTCGCGVTGESLVARVEWGVCSVPSDNAYPYRRLADFVDWKEQDHGTIILPKDPSTGRFEETTSPLQLQITPGTTQINLLRPSAPASPLIPDDVRFIFDGNAPAGYCSDPSSPLTFNTGYTWPTGRMNATIYSAPVSTCSGTSWHFASQDTSMRLTIPSTSGASITFCAYAGTIGSPRITGWLSCSGTEYAARNYCNQPGSPSPVTTGPCSGMDYSDSGWWFESTLYFYVKGTLTYYNV